MKLFISSTHLSKRVQKSSKKNIKPFFTATYYEVDKLPIVSKVLQQKIYFVFVGTLVSGKNPLFAIQLVEALHKNGHNVVLTLYGEGIERIEVDEIGEVFE
jgi:glycosyltransferase involved in cell wall biosynthesis